MLRAILAATVLLLAGCARHAAAPAASSFSFALLGDVPYSADAEPGLQQMLRRIDDDPSVRFVLHAGDLKGSGESCSDELLRRRVAQLQAVHKPLVYTPGDNEWTDCHRPGAGSYMPLERLDALRRLAWPDPGRSLGQSPLAVQSQAGFPENAQFSYGRVAFVSLHVTGSNNGLEPWRAKSAAQSKALREEQLAAFARREAANLAWLESAFARAHADEAIGVVVLMHANPRFELPPGDARRAGFEAILAALARLAAGFGRPVLLLHGDEHVFIDDHPLAEASPPVPNLRRVQTFGHPFTQWLRIDVDAGSSALFRLGVGPKTHAITG